MMKNLFITLTILSLFGVQQKANAQYCSASSQFADYRAIAGVTTTFGITNINNGTATNQNGNPQPSYRDYTNHKVTLLAGNVFNIQLSATNYHQYMYVWVDWNNDNDFNDPGEYIWNNPMSVNAWSSAMAGIQVPATASNGPKRMRIRSFETLYAGANQTGISPCGAVYRGETEDYTIEVIAPSCPVTPGTINSNAASACTGGNESLSLVGATTGININYQWRSSTDGVNWTNVGTNSTSYNTGAVNATTMYKAIVTCTSVLTVDSTPVFTFTINPIVPHSVSIAAAPGTTICLNENATFTATSVNGGTTPGYQWKRNGVNVGTNSNTYTINTLVDGDIITVTDTSYANCPDQRIDTSNALTMTVLPLVTPTVSIASSNNGIVCSGDMLTLTATVSGEGTTPTYTWYNHGNVISSGAATLASSSFINGDNISLELKSSEACATPAIVRSNAIRLNITRSTSPSVNIIQTGDPNVCAGRPMTLVANPVNAGINNTYQWRKNGQLLPNTTNTITEPNPQINDYFRVRISSNAVCSKPDSATMGMLVLDVKPLITPTVAITATPATKINKGEAKIFNATITNGGYTPTYQWLKNGQPIPDAIMDNYVTRDLDNNDVITCQLTSNVACANPAVVQSNAIAIEMFTTSVDVLGAQHGVAIYPNPNNGRFAIEADIAATDAGIEVTDALGRVVYTSIAQTINGKLKHDISLDNVSKGLYIVKITAGGAMHTAKLLVQ